MQPDDDLAQAFADLGPPPRAAGLSVALECAARGWHVFPCGPDKQPLTRHGFKDATTDPEGVQALWASCPQASIGVATGASGLVVVDLDCKNGQPGLDEWHKIVSASQEPLEATTLVETPSGGMHVYYQANGHRVASSAGRLAPGIDARAEGGYVIAGGSPGYLYVDGHGPELLAPLPPGLGERLSFAKRRNGDEKPAGQIPEGRRDSTLASLAGTMRRRGLSADAIYAALAAENKASCKPPLPDAQVRKIAGSVGRYEPARPVQTQEEDPAPLDSTPASTIAYIDWPLFWAQDHAEQEWLFDDVLAKGRAHSIYAKHGTGKSLFAVYMAAQIAASGKAVVQYLDYEMTEADLFERLDDMGYGTGTDFSRLRYAMLPSLPPLDTAVGAAALMGAVDALQEEFPDVPVVTILDTMSRAVRGEENDADTFRAFYSHTGIRLKQRGVTWVRLDHAGKDKDQGQRGSSSKGDDVDVVWRLETSENGIVLKREKTRMAWVPEIVTFGVFYGPLRYARLTEDWPAGTGALANLLDRLDVSVEATVRVAGARLRDVGEGRRQSLIVAALKWRRDRLAEPGNTPGNSGNRPGVTDPVTSGNKAQFSFGNTPGNSGTQGPGVTGNTGDSLRESVPGSTLDGIDIGDMP
jgi:KaiC/GvpD/RAD55 family RecA-like ATPase